MKIKYHLPIPKDILQLKDIFKKNGYKLYIVGGAVRDSILKKPIKDYDLATDAVPEKIEQMMLSNGIKTLATGKAFGVINVFTSEGEYEIATFRKDLSKGRRPDAVEFTDIENDVNRRDLTINALFYDIDSKEIVDLVGGLSDLKNGIVRTVGQAEDRFDEDKLRILRAIRFAGRFGSDLDPQIDAVLKKGIDLSEVSPERIRDEFLKGIKTSKSVVYFLSLIKKYNLFKQIFPNLEINTLFIENKDPIIVLSVLLYKNTNLNKALNKLTYSINEIKGITFLINLLGLDTTTAFTLKTQQKVANINETQISIFGKFMGINTKLIHAFNQFQLTISGDDIMRDYNLKPGKEVGDLIKSIETKNFESLL